MTNNLMSASFPLRASKSDDLFLKKIVIAGKAWRSYKKNIFIPEIT